MPDSERAVSNFGSRDAPATASNKPHEQDHLIPHRDSSAIRLTQQSNQRQGNFSVRRKLHRFGPSIGGVCVDHGSLCPCQMALRRSTLPWSASGRAATSLETIDDTLFESLQPPVTLSYIGPTSGVSMHLRHKRVTGHGRAVDRATPRGSRPAEFVVRWERRPDALIVWLSGALDRATSTLLDRELDTQAIRPMRLVVDLTGVEFIDESDLDTLVRIHQRACQSGDRLSFRRGGHVAQRPLELTRTVQLRSRWATRHAGVSHEDSYFALAIACADVDHPRPGDRPRAA